MCGRYTLRSRGSAKFYGVPVSQLPFLAPRYNIAPTQSVPVILARGAERELAMFQWGLIPSWSKEPKGFINARAETLLAKPSFSESFQRRRCLIPADGFYEWQRHGRSKQPYFFQMKDETPFAFAGVWDKWQGSGRSITSCAIITTTPNQVLATIHDRMPVILGDDEAQDSWLRSNARPAELKELLVPFRGSLMKSFPVSSRANSAEADDAQLVEEIEIRREPTTGLLF
jgi:putative SOS response-associated peptidase YedK